MVSRKDVNDVIKEIKSHGCEAILYRGHWRVSRDGVYLTTIASTPGDRRSLLNAQSKLRQLGIPLKRK